MEKLEMINSFRERFGEELNPKLISVKYCQNSNNAWVEFGFTDTRELLTVDLDIIGGDIIENPDGTPKEALPLFDPRADIIANAQILLQLDELSIIMVLDTLLSAQAIERIAKEHNQGTGK